MRSSLTQVESPRTFPGAVAPQRHYRVDADGVGIAVNEWGDERDPVLVMVHGGADFSRTFDVFAPLFAAAGWRAWLPGLVAWLPGCPGCLAAWLAWVAFLVWIAWPAGTRAKEILFWRLPVGKSPK